MCFVIFRGIFQFFLFGIRPVAFQWTGEYRTMVEIVQFAEQYNGTDTELDKRYKVKLLSQNSILIQPKMDFRKELR